MTSYDARIEIYEHITEVRGMMLRVAEELIRRAHEHDASKFIAPEIDEYLNYTPVLEGFEYGSEEEKAARQKIDDKSTKHHYEVCRHHPEHFPNGIHDMNLVDLIEMLCDWKAAGDFVGWGPYEGQFPQSTLATSIERNAARFGYGDELKRVLLNTAEMLNGA